MYRILLTTALLASMGLAHLSAQAEIIQIPIAQQAADIADIPRPITGNKHSAVLAQWGEPMAISGPVGEPPISRWEYPDFYVYFEYEHVVHSVLKHIVQEQ
ncbi:MAG: hypothetical protein V7711_09525 [Pseudomonadales bacterium]